MKVPCVLFVLVHLLPWIHAADLKLNSGGDALTSAQSGFATPGSTWWGRSR